MNIDGTEAFSRALLSVEKPARYVGGEFGQTIKPRQDFDIALCFPDLYEIGMSNAAVRILYQEFNKLGGVRCERVFTPASDFEKLLRDGGRRLATLESAIPLDKADLIAFSVGYELCGTGILNVLDLGGVPIRSFERGEDSPLVIAGGPAITNPHPFGRFVDAVWIGEAEDGLFDLIPRLSAAKKAGAKRSQLLEIMRQEKALWMPGKSAVKSTFWEFSQKSFVGSGPIPSLKPVHDHGVVEIMRGCPNGCRFCHAGIYYRPFRMKESEVLWREVDDRVRKGGYREISLQSLSSGDFKGIDRLIQELNGAYGPYGVSFQLPSLKVNSFTMPLLEGMSDVRKGGLTFAVETPLPDGQARLNKDVSFEKMRDIIKEAKERGWKSVKLYFMLGLPLGLSPHEEVERIREFLLDISSLAKISFSVTLGAFVPKPHTPFERCSQISEEDAYEGILWLKRNLPPYIRVKYQNTFLSYLEGLVSRGDDRMADLIEKAFQRGVRLEAWEDKCDIDIWKSILSEFDPAYLSGVMGAKAEGEALPWADVSLGTSAKTLRSEWEKSQAATITEPCAEQCSHPCGMCGGGQRASVLEYESRAAESREWSVYPRALKPDAKARIVFIYEKAGKAIYYSHLMLLDVLVKAAYRSNLPLCFSQGFNPQPRLEIARALAIGVESSQEFAVFELLEDFSVEAFILRMNQSLPEGIRVSSAYAFPVIEGDKKNSLNSVFHGSRFWLSDASRKADFSAGFPNVISVEEDGQGGLFLDILEGKTKEEQLLYPIKQVYGDDLSKWPRVRCVENKVKMFDGKITGVAEAFAPLKKF
jgi:radical SAM superfamily enzyme YgiQ (UPF0313 family)